MGCVCGVGIVVACCIRYCFSTGGWFMFGLYNFLEFKYKTIKIDGIRNAHNFYVKIICIITSSDDGFEVDVFEIVEVELTLFVPLFVLGLLLLVVIELFVVVVVFVLFTVGFLSFDPVLTVVV